MKLSEIEVGTYYAVGGDRSVSKVKAIEVGVHGQVFDGWRHRRSARADYVRVETVSGVERIEPARSFRRTWEEQEEINREVARRRSRRRAERAAEERLADAAPELLAVLKVFVSEYVELVNSGDCGFWDPENETKVRRARAVIAAAEGEA